MVPVAVVALVITGTCELIVKVKVAVPVPVAFEAPTVAGNVPVVVGVPVIAPEAVFTISPGGRPVAL